MLWIIYTIVGVFYISYLLKHKTMEIWAGTVFLLLASIIIWPAFAIGDYCWLNLEKLIKKASTKKIKNLYE